MKLEINHRIKTLLWILAGIALIRVAMETPDRVMQGLASGYSMLCLVIVIHINWESIGGWFVPKHYLNKVRKLK